MKRELKKLVHSKGGSMKLSKIAHLNRWTEDGLGNPVDGLSISFNSPTGRVGFYTADIKSRNPVEISEEIAEHTRRFAAKWAEEEANRALAGQLDYKLYDINDDPVFDW